MYTNEHYTDYSPIHDTQDSQLDLPERGDEGEWLDTLPGEEGELGAALAWFVFISAISLLIAVLRASS